MTDHAHKVTNCVVLLAANKIFVNLELLLNVGCLIDKTLNDETRLFAKEFAILDVA